MPPKDAFYSELNLQGISDEDYAHAQKVWEVYVQTDTLLPSDVFEKFRDTCIEIYGLDPSLAWQAC